MFTRLVIGSALFSGSLAVGIAPTPSTSDATITPAPHIELLRKQNDARYMGWVMQNGLWSARQCELGGTYYQNADYWRCCATTLNGCAATRIPIGCISGGLIYPAPTGVSQSASLVTRPCTEVFASDKSFSICNTLFMYENERDSDPLTNINCGISSKNWSYFRVQPSAALTSSTTPSSSPPSTPASSTPTPTTTPSLPTILPEPEEEKKESKAWIAGAVVGPIVGLALIGFAVFFFMRRKKNKQAQPFAGAVGPAPGTDGTYPQQTYPPGPNSPPQYYQPPMQQNATGVPFGVSKHDSWAPQSTTPQGSMSPNSQGPYGVSPQQGWQGQNNSQINQAPPMGGQPVYGASSPPPGHAQPTQYGGGGDGMYKHTAETVRPFSSELEGSYAGQGQPEQVGVPPKNK
ncbi:uncharacterized protein K460DRAFT_368220 [Cucurbitaria berberidis CBS 394.84]|uniref:Mid2 domain-containing protein n=1 Tax=Cucurbitaria berberidis CBS 394.84 TaxID=1168544 RepID=A0A9P4L5V0_9PLEO|nr:uncharacterized protein K460DRAFT_368220 [Cucurbitaria berberidis CBS 394.84]KAF1843321.1 hypothetical protein K460DRAFT_368220 [Cucurbitaria berberidis CBS 394.84]